ncbi:hypothetical protein [Leptospira sp. GIMC2001]|uniref:hypothetical protein n=1 Tax=Leptospira sp. GIMC2001 TaxID=1513297 RepID=UPI00234B0F22|nr:hypothetical protein [Leptospira sp. GIMC2001]WCL49931.1 hypothetical protein O4O04_03685 [Leptospira sp. GIMC2001]
MDKRKWLFVIVGTIVLLLVIILLPKTDKDSDQTAQNDSKDSPWSFTSSSGGSDFSNFPEAPRPEDQEKSMVEKLWPHALEAKDPKLKEKVRKEWQDFARKYPNNVYIPNEYKGTLNEAEEKQILDNLDSFTAVESKFASMIAASKYAAPGSEPPASPSEKDANPKEMATYFDYKVKEMESRIELLEYTLENSRLSSVEESIASKDIASYKKELASLREAKSQVPSS